jgi:hypothetical protein
MRKRNLIDLEPHGAPLAGLLGQINVQEHDSDNPLISAVVVSRENETTWRRVLEHRARPRPLARRDRKRTRTLLAHIAQGLPRTMEELNAAAVVAQLEQAPVTPQSAIQPPPAGAPNSGGFYAWWAERDAIADVPERLHPLDPSLTLLYVGISPATASSQQALRGRLLGNHINRNTSSSSFRFSLASLLLAELNLQPRRAAKKVVLSTADNVRLREWQFARLRLTWCARERAWEIEYDVIQFMQHRSTRQAMVPTRSTRRLRQAERRSERRRPRGLARVHRALNESSEPRPRCGPHWRGGHLRYGGPVHRTTHPRCRGSCSRSR